MTRASAPRRVVRLQWGHDLSVVESRSRSTRACPTRTCFNGATTSRSWNLGSIVDTFLEDRTGLQWGHDLSVVESERHVESGTQTRHASMGPRPLGRGIKSMLPPVARSKMALQWGHDLSVVESRAVVTEMPRNVKASMGPRPLGRGIPRRENSSAPWADASMGSRPLGRGINLPLRIRSNSSKLQWGHDLSVVESTGPGSPPRSTTSFNGATTSRSWNHVKCTRRPCTAGRASMGPRPLGRGIWEAIIPVKIAKDKLQWGHDLSVVESARPGSTRRARPASMGPRSLGRGIPSPAPYVVPVTLLQWGRDLSVVESIRHGLGSASSPRASMGPRPLGRGIPGTVGSGGVPGAAASMGPRPLGRGICSSIHWLAGMRWLQWGHDLSVVESRVCVAAPRVGARASMGPRPLGRGISARRWVLGGQSRASMGPRPLGRGIAPFAAANGAQTTRFNGATTSRSWNRAEVLVLLASDTTLQWGHDLSVVESTGPSPLSRWYRAASMGPRPLGRGIRTRAGASPGRARRFNGATTSRSWNPSARRAPCRRGPASMGPRPLGRGIRGRALRPSAGVP